MKYHQQQIIKALKECSGLNRGLFGLFATERLHACCWAAHANSHIWPIFSRTLDYGFRVDFASTSHDHLIEMIKQLESIVPEGGEPLQVQGQSAIICLLEGLRLIIEFDEQIVEGIINAVIDVLDNYVFYVQRMVAGEMISPENYLLLERELRKQLEDVEFIKTTPSTENIRKWRIENLQFAAPVAVGFV